MSCPDWRALAQNRDDSADTEPAGWSDAVTHFESGCPRCRRDALAAEPTLIFRSLRSAPVEATAAMGSASMGSTASEVDAVRQAVAAMRTASRVDAIEGRSRAWKRWAVAACLAVAALSISADNSHRSHQPREQREQASLPSRPVVPLRAATASNIVPAALSDDAEPLTVEGINRPGARVYHMDGEGMSVVMIVDESFDV
jgi:hypothetical protein